MAMTLEPEPGAALGTGPTGPARRVVRPAALGAGKVVARYLERRAYVYVRQSTAKQVQQHRESQTNQYALVERAVGMGWPLSRVQVIDADLGQSGQDSDRAGFQELVAEVSLGHAGIVLAYEASRLARNNADWYRLLDLATVVGTLIADADGVYDPRSDNDRLLLGLRGMLSEAELHLLRLRLDAGRQRQVERGTYRQRLPTGLVRLPDGRVGKDPDQQVQHAIALVLARFAALGICQKVVRSLRDDGVLLPRFQSAGLYAGQLLWKRPSEAAVYDILRNPAYAGAFVYGRHAPHPDRRPGQRTRLVNVPMADWTAIHRDVYPAYISWVTPAHQKTLRRTLVRRVVLTRSTPDTVDVKVVWVSGAVSLLTVEPAIHRATDRHDYATLIDRMLALGAEGQLDGEIARRLTAEGFRSARATHVPKALVGTVRRAHGQTALFEQFRRQDHIDGQWTVWGLARHLGVTRNWLYDRIRQGTLPATRHPATGHHLIAAAPALLDQLRAQVPAQRRRHPPPASPSDSEAPACVA